MEALTASPAEHSTAWHEARKLDAAWWQTLAVVGAQDYAPDADDDSWSPYRLVLANCSCGSTLAIEAAA